MEICSICLTAPSREILAASVAALEANHGERLQNLVMPDQPQPEGYWQAQGLLLVKPKKPRPTPPNTDNRAELLKMAAIGVLCAINLFIWRPLLVVSPLDNLNLATIGLISLGLGWHYLRRAIRIKSN